MQHQLPNEILTDFLYLGDASHAKPTILVKAGITHLINITNDESPEQVKKCCQKVLFCSIRDHPSEDISVFFEQAIDFLNQAQELKAKVLVHCGEGKSRSVSLVVAYLVSGKKMTLNDACFYVWQKRMIADPNNGFMRRLVQFEKQVLGTSSVDYLLPEHLADDWGWCFQDVIKNNLKKTEQK